MTKTKIPFLNDGKEFELQKLNLGGREALLKFRAENPEPTLKEVDKRVYYLSQMKKLMVVWTLKRTFKDRSIEELTGLIDEEMSIEDFEDLSNKILELNFGKIDKVADPPKNETEKK
jgi:hypothetical protein